VPIKQKVISDEETIPTRLFGIKRECEKIVRITVLAEILHIQSVLHLSP
jgi:hypothetical protein